MNKNGNSHALREQANIERLKALVASLEQTTGMSVIADVLTGEADRVLCSGLGNAGASRWWRRYVVDLCGRHAGLPDDRGWAGLISGQSDMGTPMEPSFHQTNYFLSKNRSMKHEPGT